MTFESLDLASQVGVGPALHRWDRQGVARNPFVICHWSVRRPGQWLWRM